MTWKKVSQSDAGTATKFGGNDLDKVSDAFNGVNVSDPIKYNTDINTLYATTNAAGDLLKSNGTKYVRFPKGSANQVIRVNAAGTDLEYAAAGGGGGDVTGAANVGAGTGTIYRDEVTGVINLKTLAAGSNVTLTNNANDVTITATGASAAVQPYTYFIYKDPADSLFKARRGGAGTILSTTSATNVTAVLDAVVADISPPTTPAVIEFASGDFPMTTVFNNITVPVIGNLTVRGQGMGATNLVASTGITSGTVFEIFGATSGSQTNLTANAAAGDATIAVTSATGFAAGDTILLRSTAAFSSAASAQGKKGEIHKIVSIATNTITLDKYTHDSYDTATTANIIKLATLDNITLQDITLKAGAGYTGTGTFFAFLFCDNLRINRVHVQNSLGTAFDVRSSINWTADVVIEQTPNATFNSQYGFKPTSACENGVANVTAIGRWRHAVTIDASGTAGLEGQVRNVVFTGTAEVSDEAAWDTHATGENISFRNCNVQAARSGNGTSDAKGFQMRAKKCNVQNCNVWEGVGKGITLMEDASGSIVSGCNINRSRQLPGNSTLGHGIEIRGSTNNVVITGNNIEGSHREAILFRSSSSGHIITGNIINGSNNEGIDAPDITNVVVSGNRITGCSKAINMTGTSDNWNIVGNSLSGNSGTSTVSGASNKILGNRGDATLDDGVSATALDGLTDVAITSAARGDIIVRDATQYINKAKGTANQFLRMDGTGTDPTWQTVSVGGGTTIQGYNYLIYIDSGDGSYKALNGYTGAVDYTHATDVTQVLKSIFAAVTTGQLTIVMSKGDFKIRSWNEADFRRSNFSILGQGEGITRFLVTNDIETVAGHTRAMAFEASQGSTTTTLTANATKGAQSISVTSAASFTAGDDIILCSDEDWDTTFAADDRTQLNRIVSISGTTLMLEKFASETFNTASNARIIKQPLLRNIYLANFSIEADTGYTNTGTTWLRFDLCDNVLAENIILSGVTGTFHKGLVTNMVINSTFRHFKMEVPPTTHFTTGGPYGISCRAACEHVVYDDFRFRGGWRHAFTTTGNQSGVFDGVPKEIFITNCTSETCGEASFDTHGNSECLYFINCAVNGYRSPDSTDTVAGTGDTDCFNLRSKYVTIINPMVMNTRGNGINVTSQGHGIKISGGYFRNIRNGMKAIHVQADCEEIQISDCDIENVDGEGIMLDTNVRNVQISNCRIKNTCTADNTVSPLEFGTTTHDVIVNNVMIDTSNDAAIRPISIASGAYDYTLSNITALGAGIDCAFNGFNIRLDYWTCTGRNLAKPLRKPGTWTASVPGSSTSGILNGNVTATGGTRRIEPADGLHQEFATTTLNTTQGLRGTNNYFERDLNPYIRFTFRLETTSLTRMFLLWSNLTSLPSGADPLVSLSGIGLKFDSGGTNFLTYSNSGDATTTTGATIAAANTNKHDLEIRGDAANNKFQIRYDFGSWVDVTTDIPANNSEMTFQAYMENNETGVNKILNLLEIETSIDNK